MPQLFLFSFTTMNPAKSKVSCVKYTHTQTHTYTHTYTHTIRHTHTHRGKTETHQENSNANLEHQRSEPELTKCWRSRLSELGTRPIAKRRQSTLSMTPVFVVTVRRPLDSFSTFWICSHVIMHMTHVHCTPIQMYNYGN